VSALARALLTSPPSSHTDIAAADQWSRYVCRREEYATGDNGES
jgi:hypothetical protein